MNARTSRAKEPASERPRTRPSQPPRMEPLARLPVFFALDWQARGGGRRHRRPRPGRRNCCRPPAPHVDVFADDASRRDARARRAIRRAARSCSIARAWERGGFRRRRDRGRRVRRRRRSRRASPRRRAPPASRSTSSTSRRSATSRSASIVNRSPLVIGISTDGAAPVFAQAIRAKLEALIPRGFARWAEAARRWRDGRANHPACRSPAGAGSGRCSPRPRCGQPDREPAAARLRSPDRRNARAEGAKRRATARSRWSAPGPAIRNC